MVNLKLEHFIQALEFNNINIEKLHQEGTNSGVIKISEYISVTYFISDKSILSAQIIYSAIATYKPDEQLKHMTEVLEVTKAVIKLLCDIDGIEVMRALGLFDDGTFKPKEKIYLENKFKIDSVNGLMLLTMVNEVN